MLLHACLRSIMYPALRDKHASIVTGYFQANPTSIPVSEYFGGGDGTGGEQMDLPMLCGRTMYDLPGWLKMVHDLGIADTCGVRLLLRAARPDSLRRTNRRPPRRRTVLTAYHKPVA